MLLMINGVSSELVIADRGGHIEHLNIAENV